MLFNVVNEKGPCGLQFCALQAETGRLLTASVERKPEDFFHSRLTGSPHGRRLLSAGWVWHPWSAVVCFDVARALADPRHLDEVNALPYSRKVCLAEESSACWLDDDRIAVAASGEPGDPEESREAGPGPDLLPRGLAVYDLAGGTCLRAFQLDEPAGTILAIGADHVLSLYRHPKLIELATGRVLHVWTELHSGLQDGSMVCGLEGDAKPPPMAIDPAGRRFTIVNGDAVTVIEFTFLTGALCNQGDGEEFCYLSSARSANRRGRVSFNDLACIRSLAIVWLSENRDVSLAQPGTGMSFLTARVEARSNDLYLAEELHHLL